MDSDGPKRAASLKSHKTLPRNTSTQRESSDSHVSKEVERIERRMSQAQEKSDDISSWIGDSSQVLPDPNLPLTPPSLPKDLEDENIEEQKITGPVPRIEEKTKPTPNTQRTQTPVLQRSPPTPDQTPPRAGQYPRSRIKTHLTPPPTLRQPSSVAESFKTANEHPLSDEETATVTSDRNAKNVETQPMGVGLGLGLELSEGSKTPTVCTPSAVPKIQTLDEPWDENVNVVSDDPFVASELVTVQQMQAPKKHRRRRKRSKATTGRLSTPEDFQASLERDAPLRDRMGKEREVTSSSSVEKFAAQIQWPSASDDLGAIHVDEKRLSELSNQSQVVQALVVSTPPQRRQRLRHSSKNESLRTAGSPLNDSNRSSLVSNESKAQLYQRRAKPTQRGHRVSANSDSGISMGSDLRKKVQEALPASEIPQRRSSLRSSKKRLPNLRNFAETEDRSEKRRPDTAPGGVNKPLFGAQSHRQGTISDANPAVTVNETRGRKPKATRPTVPPRSSSLSAPTSRNVSRTTSLTSTSLHKHNIQQQSVQQETPSQPQAVTGPQRQSENFLKVESEDKRASDDMSGGRHRSLLTTPFSMASMQSSTPGPYEVNEATAINIYPHNNTSVLVVQQLPRRGSEQPRLSASLSGNVQINLDSFRSPPRVPSSRRVMDSPLKNPREPPKPPPPVVLVPPTPAALESASPSRGRRSATSSISGSGPISLVRRALSARRYSESFINPITQTFVKRNSSTKTSGNRKRVRSDGKSDQISAFRKPRGFWNDLSDDEEEAPRQAHTQRPGFIRTSIRGPAEAYSGANGTVRRLGSLRSRSRPRREMATAVNDSDGTYVSYGDSEYQLYDGSVNDYEHVERNVGTLSRLRNTSYLRPFTSLQDAIREMKQKRIEDQLERQRERLRKNIGPVILQQDARPFY
ncbi:MAG: hypothetical protein MMC23_002559 [Stictis urceolatum]|nr:hypothetical protein [Stictis urceolata]